MSTKIDGCKRGCEGSRPLTSFVAVLSLSIALGMITPAKALVPVTDASHQIANIISQVTTRAQEAAQFAKENTQFAREWQQIQDTYTSVKNILEINMASQSFNMVERSEDFGMKERCPGLDTGFSLSGMIDRTLPDDKKSIPAQQALICGQIVRVENQKHNALVKMFKTAAERGEQAGTVAKNAKSSRTMGEQNANVMSAQSVANVTQADVMSYQAKVQAYDAMISSLKNDNTLLAKRALKGSTSTLGKIITTGALAAALKVNESK